MGITRVVSVDGGGIRGIVPVIVMQRLTAEPGLGGWLDQTQLLAGTSTGGIIALSIAAGVPLVDLRELYTTRAATVFADSFLDDLRDVGKVFGADYDVDNLEREAHRVLGDRTLAQLTKRVLVTAFDLDNGAETDRQWKAKLFHNYPGPDSDGDMPRTASPWRLRRRRPTSRRTTATSTAASSRPIRACARSRRRRTRGCRLPNGPTSPRSA